MVLLLLSILTAPLNAFAHRSEPAQADFNYGAQVDHTGDHLGIAFFLASELGLDWIGMDLDWAQTWPDQTSNPDFSHLAHALAMAEENQLPVLLNLTNAPSWAMAQEGPMPAATADLVARLARLSPALQAVELFPEANTAAGWGAAPDPAAYLRLFQAVETRLQQEGLQVQLIAAGLAPLPPNAGPGDQDDLEYLEGLYKHGGAALVSNLSVRLPEITGQPDDSPFSTEHRVLRRYERVRQLMLHYGHLEGMIWITSFTWPSGKISPDDSKFGDPDLQAQWLHRAYNLLSSQLYIKVAFFDRLNPPRGDASQGNATHSLIQPAGSFHPGLRSLGLLTSFDGSLPISVPESIIQKKLQFWKARLKPDP